MIMPSKDISYKTNYNIIKLEDLNIERLCRNFEIIARKATNNEKISLILTTEVFIDIKNISLSIKERESVLLHLILMDAYGAYFDENVLDIVTEFIDDLDEKLNSIMRRFHQQKR